MLPHKLSQIFPPMSDEDLQALADDIKANGLKHKIVVYEEKILDGNNREAACKLAGVTPQYELFSRGDPLRFVIASNLHRRHLDVSQRALIASRLSNLNRGSNLRNESANLPIAQKAAANALGVSERSVQDAATVLANGTPKQIADVESGDKSVSATAKQVRDKKKKATTKAEPMQDANGTDVPEHLRDKFATRWLIDTPQAIEDFVRDAVRRAERDVKSTGPKFPFLVVQEALDQLAAIKEAGEHFCALFRQARPHVVCPLCEGKKCKDCRNGGLLPEWRVKELKKEGAI